MNFSSLIELPPAKLFVELDKRIRFHVVIEKKEMQKSPLQIKFIQLLAAEVKKMNLKNVICISSTQKYQLTKKDLRTFQQSFGNSDDIIRLMCSKKMDVMLLKVLKYLHSGTKEKIDKKSYIPTLYQMILADFATMLLSPSFALNNYGDYLSELLGIAKNTIDEADLVAAGAVDAILSLSELREEKVCNFILGNFCFAQILQQIAYAIPRAKSYRLQYLLLELLFILQQLAQESRKQDRILSCQNIVKALPFDFGVHLQQTKKEELGPLCRRLLNELNKKAGIIDSFEVAQFDCYKVDGTRMELGASVKWVDIGAHTLECQLVTLRTGKREGDISLPFAALQQTQLIKTSCSLRLGISKAFGLADCVEDFTGRLQLNGHMAPTFIIKFHEQNFVEVEAMYNSKFVKQESLSTTVCVASTKDMQQEPIRKQSLTMSVKPPLILEDRPAQKNANKRTGLTKRRKPSAAIKPPTPAFQVFELDDEMFEERGNRNMKQHIKTERRKPSKKFESQPTNMFELEDDQPRKIEVENIICEKQGTKPPKNERRKSAGESSSQFSEFVFELPDAKMPPVENAKPENRGNIGKSAYSQKNIRKQNKRQKSRTKSHPASPAVDLCPPEQSKAGPKGKKIKSQRQVKVEKTSSPSTASEISEIQSQEMNTHLRKKDIQRSTPIQRPSRRLTRSTKKTAKAALVKSEESSTPARKPTQCAPSKKPKKQPLKRKKGKPILPIPIKRRKVENASIKATEASNDPSPVLLNFSVNTPDSKSNEEQIQGLVHEPMTTTPEKSLVTFALMEMACQSKRTEDSESQTVEPSQDKEKDIEACGTAAMGGGLPIHLEEPSLSIRNQPEKCFVKSEFATCASTFDKQLPYNTSSTRSSFPESVPRPYSSTAVPSAAQNKLSTRSTHSKPEEPTYASRLHFQTETFAGGKLRRTTACDPPNTMVTSQRQLYSRLEALTTEILKQRDLHVANLVVQVQKDAMSQFQANLGKFPSSGSILPFADYEKKSNCLHRSMNKLLQHMNASQELLQDEITETLTYDKAIRSRSLASAAAFAQVKDSWNHQLLQATKSLDRAQKKRMGQCKAKLSSLNSQFNSDDLLQMHQIIQRI